MEKLYADRILQILTADFYVQPQVWGTHFSGARLRIDAVLKPKDTTQWIKQCIDYANTNWDNYGYMYIFSCPSIFDKLEYATNGNQWLWNRILSNLGVGRLDNHKYYGWTFFLQDTHRVWSQRDGLASGKHWTLKRKFGRDSFKHV